MTRPKVVREERGWAGHFICASRCLFRRNTLLTCGDRQIVISTIGAMQALHENGYETIGYDRYYETMAFESMMRDTRFHDADESKEHPFKSQWSISHLDADDEANAMHERVVKELTVELSRSKALGGAR